MTGGDPVLGGCSADLVAAGSVAALFLQQASLHVGPLRASQLFLVIVDPMVSITLSIWLFGEHFTDNTAALALAAAGFAVMCAGIVVLTQTAPATMAADIPDGQEGGQHGRRSGPADSIGVQRVTRRRGGGVS